MTIKWPDAWKEILVWTISGISILVLCLIATFPYSALQNRVVAELKQATGLDVRIGDWTIGLPLSLEWRNVSLSKPNLDPVELTSLQARLGVFEALRGTLGLDVLVQLGEQTLRTNFVKGTLTAATFSMAGPLTLKGQLQQVDLPKLIRRWADSSRVLYCSAPEPRWSTPRCSLPSETSHIRAGGPRRWASIACGAISAMPSAHCSPG